jgi:hypothetical protein
MFRSRVKATSRTMAPRMGRSAADTGKIVATSSMRRLTSLARFSTPEGYRQFLHVGYARA